LEVADMDKLVNARNIYRSFETAEGMLEVLKGVNLSVRRGDMVAVVGESGVGKSTLLHILGGLDRPTSGEVAVGGDSFAGKSETELALFRNAHIGFVFQHHFLMDDFTALENVMIPALVAGKPRDEAADRAEQWLTDVGLKDRMSHLPNQLSGGEQQRTAVARALINDPDIIIADEPSGNLDIKTGEKLHRMLTELNKERQVTFIIATHNKELAQSCRLIEKLKNGRLCETENS
jgi:lipoprotein-releasing system ATP-binding protein